tara:strand:+ start:22149 stop:22988 length:840 start_codon:yes stop_codon:yes gene_type:complete
METFNVKREDLSDVTFIVPLRIESQDRMRNIITSMIYLLRNFKTTVIVKECDEEKIFERSALGIIKDAVGGAIEDLNYVYEKSSEYTFHRTKILNDMIMMTKTPVVVNYDSDILLPKTSYIRSRNEIINGTVNVVYPYGMGDWQFQLNTNDSEVTNFINSNFNFDSFKNYRKWDAKFGFCQFFNTEEYKKWGMENENFIAYGYEDDERHYRFSMLTSVGRIDDFVYHMEHGRTSNSWFNNPYIEKNRDTWETLRVKGPEGLIKYYKEQEYVKSRGLNIG